MSSLLPTREQAIGILQENNCPRQVINHCLAVAEIAVELANQLKGKGQQINVELVLAGALLHDLGRSKSQTVNHSLVGAQIAQEIGLPATVVNIIKRHVGAGITSSEAEVMGWPVDVYVPQTLEEKVVAYADKLIGNSKRVPIEKEIRRLRKENKMDAAERVKALHEEMTDLLGGST